MNVNDKLKSFLYNKVFEIPYRGFSYDPCYRSDFSVRGQTMVESLLTVAPCFNKLSSQYLPVYEMAELTNEIYADMQSQLAVLNFITSPAEREELLRSLRLESGKTGYFRSKRRFTNVVPKAYYRTNAPRLSVKGSTLHGMHVDLKRNVLIGASLHTDCSFLDLDLGAAHAAVATSFLSSRSVLAKVLSVPNFWDTQVTEFQPRFKGLITSSELRKILKIGLYTALNGGTPYSERRLTETLKGTASKSIGGLKDPAAITKLPIYSLLEAFLREYTLLKEVKDLNLRCSVPLPSGRYHMTYAIDRFEPYIYKSPHMGISRVLQSVEVIMLAVLVRSILIHGGVPISLDHDGCLVLIPKFMTKEQVKSLEISLTKEISAWSEYLVHRSIPVVAKMCICDGQIVSLD